MVDGIQELSATVISVMVAVVIAAAVTSCTSPLGSGAEDLAASSSADLLIPVDSRFSSAWEFTLHDSADNYTIRSNWDPTFNPDIDKESMVVGFQINRVETWTGEADAETPEFVEVMKNLPGDSAPDSDSEACQPYIERPLVVRCRHDLGDRGQLTLLVRRIDNGSSTTIVVAYDDGGTVSEDFITGDFKAVPIDEAADQWLVDA